MLSLLDCFPHQSQCFSIFCHHFDLFLSPPGGEAEGVPPGEEERAQEEGRLLY
ncbi:hypothetical protein E2C01_070589 [Portunus trituberculatus]|uniref:Uncharacterized protein n=1 Tax=Portunus trituberculatus TaxID=210409 RepID=A0A5B7I1Q3_PORTR|nr:hypothetical protein [Portunus trituberculatus]